MCNAPMEGVKRMWHGGSYSPQSAIESENSVRAFPKSRCTMQNAFGRARTPLYILAKCVRARPKRYCVMKNVFRRARRAIATLQQLF